MIVGDKLILMNTSCKERYFVYNDAIKQDNIVGIVHVESNCVTIDVAPEARHLSLKEDYKTVLSAFYDLDMHMAFPKAA
jgi:hypothetical protein